MLDVPTPRTLPRRTLLEAGSVLAQRLVGDGGEIAAVQPLLDPIDLTGTVITADALHSVAAHARYLCQRGGHYVFTVKTNRPKLYPQLDALPGTKPRC